jgi:hypothetical protein
MSLVRLPLGLFAALGTVLLTFQAIRLSVDSSKWQNQFVPEHILVAHLRLGETVSAAPKQTAAPKLYRTSPAWNALVKLQGAESQTTTAASRYAVATSSVPDNTLTSPIKADACASPVAHQGLVIVSLLGRLGNNLFQVALANRLAKALCWRVVYRPSWQGALKHDARLRECFPQAFYPQASAAHCRDVPASLKPLFNLTAEGWSALQRQRSNQQFDAFRDRLLLQHQQQEADDKENTGWWYDLEDKGRSDKGAFLDGLVESIHNESLPTRILHLRGFFIHYDWVRDGLSDIREWTTVAPACCQTQLPSKDTVVLHWRDFNTADGQQFATPGTDWVQVYRDILEQHSYGSLQQPLIILTQPASAQTPEVQRLANLTNATVVTGVDVPDAMCLLQRAETLLLSYASTFSQGPALFGKAHHRIVHYPIVKLRKPAVTVHVPYWKYHLVNTTGIARFDVPFAEIQET